MSCHHQKHDSCLRLTKARDARSKTTPASRAQRSGKGLSIHPATCGTNVAERSVRKELPRNHYFDDGISFEQKYSRFPSLELPHWLVAVGTTA